MIDFQSPIFSAVSAPLRERYAGIKVVSAISNDAASFPCVQIEESGNTPVQDDNGPVSLYARVTYHVRIYTSGNEGRVAEARRILASIDDILEPLNFRRIAFSPMSGLYGNSVYRIDATYRAVIDSDGRIYRR